MILTIDLGNYNIVVAGVEGDNIVFEARLRTDPTKTSDEYCIDLKMILEVYNVTFLDEDGAVFDHTLGDGKQLSVGDGKHNDSAPF